MLLRRPRARWIGASPLYPTTRSRWWPTPGRSAELEVVRHNFLSPPETLGQYVQTRWAKNIRYRPDTPSGERCSRHQERGCQRMWSVPGSLEQWEWRLSCLAEPVR